MKQNDKPTRMTYLRIGEAVPMLFVAAERHGNALRCGHIVEITPTPERRHRRPRICTVRQPGGTTFRESETNLLIIAEQQ